MLSSISKVFKNFLNQQISAHFENIFSKQQTGFYHGFNAQHCLSVLLKKFRNVLQKGGDYAALFTDLSKAFDCIPHNLSIAKRHTCGFDMPLLKLRNSYLTNRLQIIKITNSYSLWKLIEYAVPQISI